MESLKVKKVTFYPTEIVFQKRKGDVTIHINDIEDICYHRPHLSAYIWSALVGPCCTPKLFHIVLKGKINGRKNYALTMEYEDVLKLQSFFQMHIIVIDA